jgi:hypothetical protein
MDQVYKSIGGQYLRACYDWVGFIAIIKGLVVSREELNKYVDTLSIGAKCASLFKHTMLQISTMLSTSSYQSQEHQI